jgi:iron complex outermembrane receptor protein
MLKAGMVGLGLAWSYGMAWAADNATDLSVLKSMSLEDLGEVQVNTVVAASGFEQKTTEAPSSISIVTAEEIKRYGYRTLADILQSLQGFYVSNDRNYAYLGASGVNLGDFNSRILLLVDGHRVNNNINDGAAIGTDFILDVDLIDHIEVIRGPGSVLYGNNAFFGVINVVTRKASQVNGVEASAEYGSFNSYKVRVSVGKSYTNGVAFLLSGTYYQSDGPDQLYYKEFNTPDQNNGIAQNMNGDSYESIFGSFSYADFILQGAYINREHTDPTAPVPVTFNDPRSQIVQQRSYVDLKFTHELPRDVDLTAHLYYDQNHINTGYPLGEPTNVAFFQDNQEGQWWGAELQLNKRLWDKHTISVGAEYRDDFSQSDQLVNSGSTATYGNRQSHGVFAQGDFTLRSDLHLNAGVRYDQYGSFDSTYSPRVGLIYTPFEQSTFKAIYGTAFRDPSFGELIYQKDIQPEQIQSYELVYEQGIGQHLRSSISGFYNQMDNLLIFQDGSYQNINADAQGMELALEGHWTNGILARASYTLQKTENRSGGLDFPDSPENLIKLDFSAPLLRDKIFAGLEYQYTGSCDTQFTDPSTGATLQGPNTPGYGIFNATIFSRNLIKNLEFSVSAYNLFDTSYSQPSSQGHLQPQIAQDGRGFRVKMTYRF